MDPLAILGPGSLGLSLARYAVEKGMEVRLVGRDRGHTETGVRRLLAKWKQMLLDGALGSGDFHSRVCRISAAGNWEQAVDGASALLEALPEDLALKAEHWHRMSATWPGEVLQLTGSSSLPASLIGRTARLSPGLQNFHLFLPVHRHPLVELATPQGTPDWLATAAHRFAATLGLRVVTIHEEKGLAASRMGLAQGLEAMRLFQEGVASAQDLDVLMTSGYGHPCGPLELSDRIGLDLRLAIAQFLHESTGDPRFAPPRILKEKVAKGELGRKSGRGFFTWPSGGGKRL